MPDRGRKHRQIGNAVEMLEGRALLNAAPFHTLMHGTAAFGSVHSSGVNTQTVVVLFGKANGSIHPIATPNAGGVNTLLLADGLTQGLPGLVVFTSIPVTEIHGRRVQVTTGSGSLQPLAASTGSYMLFSYTGSGPVAKTGATQSFTISGTVNGGKGAYALSKGTISGTAVVNPMTGALTINYTLKVRPVGA